MALTGIACCWCAQGRLSHPTFAALKARGALSDGVLVTAVDFPQLVSAVLEAMTRCVGLTPSHGSRKSPALHSHDPEAPRRARENASLSMPVLLRRGSVNVSVDSPELMLTEDSTKGGIAAPTGTESLVPGASVAYYGMHLLTACILSRADAIDAFISHPQLHEWLLFFSLKAPSPMRFAVCQGIYRLCKFLPRAAPTSSPTAGDPTLIQADIQVTGRGLDMERSSREQESLGTGSPDETPQGIPAREFFLRLLLSELRRAVRYTPAVGPYFALICALLRLNHEASRSPSPAAGGAGNGAAAFPDILSASPLREKTFMMAATNAEPSPVARAAEVPLRPEVPPLRRSRSSSLYIIDNPTDLTVSRLYPQVCLVAMQSSLILSLSLVL